MKKRILSDSFVKPFQQDFCCHLHTANNTFSVQKSYVIAVVAV